MEDKIHEMTPEELEKIHSIMLDMACDFWDFCKEYNLTAYMCGGGCIGALRHKGFIPWDDDIDFFMPRKDYEIFIEKWSEYKKGSYMELSVSDRYYVDRNLFATLRNKNTTYVRPYQKDLDIVHGLALDILPLDGYPDEDNNRIKQVIWALIYSLFCAQTVPEKHGGLMAKGSKILLSIFKGQGIRYAIWSRAKKQMTKYDIEDCKSITELCSGPGYMRNRYRKEWFETYVEVPFEDRMLPIPIGAKSYLRKTFGNYMELPPVEKRKAEHNCIEMDLEKGRE